MTDPSPDGSCNLNCHILEHLDQGVSVFDADLRLVAWNDLFQNLVQLPASSIHPGAHLSSVAEGIARSCEDAPPDFVAQFSALSGREEKANFELVVGGRAILASLRPLPSGGLIATYTDVTERAHSERALRETLLSLDHKVNARTAELLRLNDALRSSQERFRRVAEAASDWIWETGPDLHFTYLSDRFSDIIGLDRAAVAGKSLDHWAMRRARTSELWREYLGLLKARRPFRNVLLTFTSRTKGPRHIMISGKPVFDDTGAFTGYCGVGTDVSAQVSAEAEAERKTAFLQATVDYLPQGVGVFDSRNRLVVANDHFLRMMGVARNLRLPGTSLDGLLREAQAAEPVLAEGLVLARTMDGEPVERTTSDGRAVEIRATALPFGGFLLSFTDITAHKRIEQSLRQSQDVARAMLSAPISILFLVEPDGRVISVNEAGARSLNRTISEVIGKNLFDCFPPEVAKRRRAHMQQAIAERRPVAFEDERTGKWYEAVFTPIRNEAGETTRLIIAAHDVTHRREAENKLWEAKTMAEMANRAKTEFLANMSHELRTPLNAIIGFSGVIANQIFGPLQDRYLEYAGDIQASGEHLLEIINDILDISRIEIGAIDLSEHAVDVAGLMRACCRLVGERAAKGGVEIVERMPQATPALVADERRLKQIVINLLSNAVKFTRPGGRVTVSAGLSENGEFFLRVSDDGIGMSPEGIEVALTPFGQVDTGLGRRYEGTGLGLPLTKGLVELHGGHLHIESALDVGTTVTVFLPACRIRATRADAEL